MVVAEGLFYVGAVLFLVFGLPFLILLFVDLLSESRWKKNNKR